MGLRTIRSKDGKQYVEHNTDPETLQQRRPVWPLPKELYTPSRWKAAWQELQTLLRAITRWRE